MGLLTDRDLNRMFVEGNPILIPWLDHSVRGGVISYGLSSAGYDIRLGESFKLFKSLHPANVHDEQEEIDPKNFQSEFLLSEVTIPKGQPLHLSPYQYALGVSVECFNMPKNVLGIAVGKSTYARCGLIVNITPLEPGWRGHLTVEIFNATGRYSRIYPGEGIAQILFLNGSGDVETSYDSKNGKYQDQQAEPVDPIVENPVDPDNTI